ncbi:class F sortase [Streptomyces sp. NBC_00876]|uniref:class F sortase n=1 Tax=Streptomyces sp. NBC_00876 TaxID=2975853 RepID=UPI0038653865|nr:class F sortase [Streptomyces sp. NBC_00876]
MHTSFARRLTAASLVTLTAVAVLTGCASGDDAPATPPAHIATSPAGPAPSGAAAAPMRASEPVRVRIPSAGVDTGPILDLGLAADGTVEVPTVAQADRIGWYTKGVTPGETGPAVLIGHFDTAEGPAVLKNVAKIRVGDRITVTRADGSDAVFAVRRLQQVDKGAFPTDEVYGDTAGPELRLITCGGDLKGGHRPDNIIAFADLVR